jgi:hypothetical protein
MDGPMLVEVLRSGETVRLGRDRGEDMDALLSRALAAVVKRIDELRRGVASPRGGLP